MSPLAIAVVQRRMMEAEALLDRTNSPEVRTNCTRIIRQCRADIASAQGLAIPYAEGWTRVDTTTDAEPRAMLRDFPVTVDTRTARERSDERTVTVAAYGSVVVVVLFLTSVAMLAGLL